MRNWKSRMRESVAVLAEQLAGIRPGGGVSVGLVETFRVSVHGQGVPLGRMASVTSKGDRILVVPFDPAHVPAVARALTEGRLNAYALDPRSVVVSVPPISGEQRAELARHVKKLGEDAKVAVRSIRQETRKQMAQHGRVPARVVQEATDAAVAEIDDLVRKKTHDLSR